MKKTLRKIWKMTSEREDGAAGGIMSLLQYYYYDDLVLLWLVIRKIKLLKYINFTYSDLKCDEDGKHFLHSLSMLSQVVRRCRGDSHSSKRSYNFFFLLLSWKTQKLWQLRMISPSGSAGDYWLFHGFKCDMVVVVLCATHTHTHTHFTQFAHATHPWQHFIWRTLQTGSVSGCVRQRPQSCVSVQCLLLAAGFCSSPWETRSHTHIHSIGKSHFFPLSLLPSCQSNRKVRKHERKEKELLLLQFRPHPLLYILGWDATRCGFAFAKHV